MKNPIDTIIAPEKFQSPRGGKVDLKQTLMRRQDNVSIPQRG